MSQPAAKLTVGNFPFANDARPLTNGRPFLGGEIHVIPAGSANANLAIAHGLKKVPRFLWVLDVGTNAAMGTPFPHGSTPWSASTIYLSVPALTAPVTILVCP